jgi:exoribonuclease-2
MERYWCLRWLLQEGVAECRATVMRENLVRFAQLPLLVRLPDMAASAPETPGGVAKGRIDRLAMTVECRNAGPAD